MSKGYQISDDADAAVDDFGLTGAIQGRDEAW
jgi:hypothetical protein